MGGWNEEGKLAARCVIGRKELRGCRAKFSRVLQARPAALFSTLSLRAPRFSHTFSDFSTGT